MQETVAPAKPTDGGRSVESLSIQSSRLGLEMFGLAGVCDGTEVPYGTVKILVQAGFATGTTDSGGYLGVSFPKPFPTACIGVVASGRATPYHAVVVTNPNKSAFAISSNEGTAGTGIYASWIALGY